MFSIASYAQSVKLEWATSVGGTSFDFGRSITIDDSGNVLITGKYEGTVDFDPGAGTFNLTSNGQWEIFIQKLDSSGNFVWAKSIGGTADDIGESISTDALGNVLVTGEFQSTADFDPGAGTFNLNSNGSSDFFVLKLDASGNFIWATSTGGISNDHAYSIATDTSGNVFITGYFQGTADFDPGAAVFNLTTNGNYDIFIQKLDAGGKFNWARSMGGGAYDYGYSLTTDVSGNVVTTGAFLGTVDFDPDTGIYNLTAISALDIFIQKLDASGNFIWAKSEGGTSYDMGYSIATDPAGNLLITGVYENTVDFDPGAGVFNLTSNGDEDIFIQKLDSGGNFMWAKSMGGTVDDNGESIATDFLCNVLTTGYFQGTVDFDPGAATFNLTSNGNWDVYIQKLDATGNFIWATSIGGTSYDTGESITSDASGNVLVTGQYQGTIDFDPGASTFNMTSNGSMDVFILKLDTSTVVNVETAPSIDVSIYPNPNSGLVTLDLGALLDVSVKIINMTGQLVYQKENISASTHQFEFKEAPGVYFIEVSSAGEKRRYKLVKE